MEMFSAETHFYDSCEKLYVRSEVGERAAFRQYEDM